MTTFKGSQLVLSAFVAFILLFSAVMAGYEYFDAGRTKASEAAWTGSQAGVAITGFLQGADVKATKSAKNPNPEVFGATRWFNQHVFSDHPKLFSWLVVLGELLMGWGVFLLLVVKFPYSRLLLIVVATLATFMNFLYLSEGVSSTNPPMAFMWLAIIWVVALAPAAGLFFAIDVKKVLGRGETAYATNSLDTSLGQWLFFLAVFAAIVAGSLAMYWDELGTWAVLAAGSVVVAAGLYELNGRLLRPATERGVPTALPSQSPGH